MADADRGAGPGPGVFELWRQDDNGNRFMTSVHEDRSSAEAALHD